MVAVDQRFTSHLECSNPRRALRGSADGGRVGIEHQAAADGGAAAGVAQYETVTRQQWRGAVEFEPCEARCCDDRDRERPQPRAPAAAPDVQVPRTTAAGASLR